MKTELTQEEKGFIAGMIAGIARDEIEPEAKQLMRSIVNKMLGCEQ